MTKEVLDCVFAYIGMSCIAFMVLLITAFWFIIIVSILQFIFKWSKD